MYNIIIYTNMQTIPADYETDEMYAPFSFFGKENTRRVKRPHEKRPKKVVPLPDNTPVIPDSKYNLRSNKRAAIIRALKRDLEMEPIIYRG